MTKNDDSSELNLRRQLYEAVSNGDAAVFRMVAKTNPSALLGGWSGGSGPGYLHLAARKGQLAVCQALLDAGLSVNVSDDKVDAVPLEEAARAGHLDVVKWLLKQGATVDGLRTSVGTPLMAAASEGRLDVAKLLLDSDAEVNREHLVHPHTALDTAVFYQVKGTGQDKVADLLRDHGGVRPYTEWHDWKGVPGQAYIEHVEEAIGGAVSPLVRSSFERGKRRVSIRQARIPKKYDYQLLLTVGVGVSGTEFALCLPSAWPLNRASLELNRYRWPLDLLTEVARRYGSDLQLDHGSVLGSTDLLPSEAAMPSGQWLVALSDVLETEREKNPAVPRTLLLIPYSGKKPLKPGADAEALADKKAREKWPKLGIEVPPAR